MIRTFLALLLVLILTQARGQGCSDAGVCTAGPIGELALNADSAVAADEPRHMARVLYSYAVGEQGTVITQGILELGIGIGARWGVQVRMPYQRSQGDLGEVSALGDPVLTTSFDLVQRPMRRFKAVAGVKLPANSADLHVNGSSLPMPYQTSLGTTDLLLGLDHRIHRWSMALAYQHVLAQGNGNHFTHAAWMDDPDALAYDETPELQRADDAVARLQYALPLGRLNVRPGLLAIVHMGRDSRLLYTLPLIRTSPPVREPIEGSQGLTLNLTLDARYRLSRNWSVELSAGTPLVVRDVRPDGLTRSLVINTGLAYRFGR